MISPVKGFSKRARFNLVSDSGVWAADCAFDPINWHPPVMGYAELLAKFDPWPFIMAFYLGLVGFFSEMKLCYVGEWGLMWCRNQAFEPINWQPLATYGNGLLSRFDHSWPRIGFFGLVYIFWKKERVFCGRLRFNLVSDPGVWANLQLSAPRNGPWNSLLRTGVWDFIY